MKPTNGFTLIELMFTLALAAIVVTLAVPGLRNFIHSNQATSEANALVGALNSARSEAVKRGIPVAVCASSDGSTCTGNNNWAVGWIVFTDNTGANKGSRDAGETLLRVGDALASGGTINAGVNHIRYLSSGLTDSAGNVTFNLVLGSGSDKQTRTVTVTATGRVSAG